MKQLYMKFLVSLVLFCGFGFTADAFDCYVDGIYYNINNTSMTASVTYYRFGYDNHSSYRGEVSIPSTVIYSGSEYIVTSIGDYAFDYCQNLTSVSIPNSVESIGDRAFTLCIGLNSVTIGNSVTTIGDYAFMDCNGLTSVIISDLSAWCGIRFGYDSNPLSYAHHLYLNGEEIKDLVIPNSVTSIGNYAFKRCTGLTSVTIGNSVTSIGDNTFSGCSGLTSVTMGNSVESIGNCAFEYCTGLTSVTIGNSVESIGNFAFEYCTGLTSVTMGNSVTSIGNYAFYRCTALTRVNITDLSAWCGIEFISSYSNPLSYAHHLYLNGEEIKDLSIPNSVTSIGDYAFYSCTGLTTVSIGNGVESIGNSGFYGCTGLTTVSIGNGVESIGNSAFNGCTVLTSVSIGNGVESIGDDAFYGCTGLVSISFYCKEIKSWFQGMTSIKEVVIGNTVNTISSNAFKNCSGLTKVSFYCRTIGTWFKDMESIVTILLGKEVTSIDKNAFYGCSGLDTIIIDADNKTYDSRNNCNAIIETSSNTLIFGCKGTDIPNSVAIIGSSAFRDCRGLTSVVIPNSVTSIGSYAFYGCTGLTSATIGNGVTSISENAFQGCTGLASVTIPNSVTNIGNSAFRDCTGLTSVTIGNSVTNIGNSAFSDCTGLTSVTIGNSVTSIGNYAFYRCAALTRVNITDLSAWCGIEFISSNSNPLSYAHHLYLNGEEIKDLSIPNSVTSIGSYAFYNCTDLTSVMIGNSVTNIGTYAFSNCTGLISVTIGNSVTSIFDSTFSGCTGLTSVTIGDNVTAIASNAFPANNNIKYYVNRGTKGLLTLWRNNYVPYDIVTSERLYKPSFSLKSTQTTLAISCTYYYDEYTYTLNNQPVSEGEWVFTNLWPETEYNYNLEVSLDNAKYSETKTFKTDYISPTVTKIRSTASSLTIQGKYYSGDAQVTEKWLTIAGSDIDGQTATFTGLNPGKYDAYFSIRVTNGSGTQSKVYTSSKTSISTESLSIVTQQPKVISAGNVIVAANSNLDDAEENVGFEWRRTDWSDDFASNSGTAYLYEGFMEGYIRNLYTEKLWKYRPFYTSASGTTYYGEWVGIDPTNTSYFEPTVHTYSTIEVQGNSASVRGYAMRGTDNITRQGFMYWPQGGSYVGRRDAPSVPANAMTVEATGTVMEAKLIGLSYNTTYCCVAFATTSEGETFYGDERQFTTDIDMSGIEEVEMSSEAATPEAWYDLSGRRLSEPRHGVNILRMSDGSSRKIYVP